VLSDGQKIRDLQSRLQSNYDKMNAKLIRQELGIQDPMLPIKEEASYEMEPNQMLNLKVNQYDGNQVTAITENDESGFFSPRTRG